MSNNQNSRCYVDTAVGALPALSTTVQFSAEVKSCAGNQQSEVMPSQAADSAPVRRGITCQNTLLQRAVCHKSHTQLLTLVKQS